MGPIGPQGPHEGGRPPWALWGPKGPRRAQGASQGAPQARGNTGKWSPTFLEKVIFRPPKRPRVGELDFEKMALRLPICLGSCVWGAGPDMLDWDQT